MSPRPAMRTLMAAAFLLAAVAPTAAQEAKPAQPAEAPAVAASHSEAAMNFLRSSGALKGFEDMIPQFLDQVRVQYVKQRPEIQDMVNEAALAVVPEFVKRRDDLTRDLAAIYTARFTEEELVQMTEFYRSPVGQKLSTIQAEVLQASVPVVQTWSRKLTTDMQSRVKEEVGKKGQKL
jgi:uncharacterized protein